MSTIAFDDTPRELSLAFLNRVDGMADGTEDQRISQAEIDAFKNQPGGLLAIDARRISVLEDALNRGTSGIDEPAADDGRSDGFFGRIGDFFGDAFKFIGDFGNKPWVQAALGAGSLLGLFFGPVGFVFALAGFIVSASSILSGLLNDDREVNWWMLIPTLLFGVQMFNPASAWGAAGGVAGFFLAEESDGASSRPDSGGDPDPQPPTPPPPAPVEPVRTDAGPGQVVAPVRS